MMRLFKKSKKETIKNETYMLILTKNGVTTREQVTEDYLRFFVESGWDLDYDEVKVEK